MIHDQHLFLTEQSKVQSILLEQTQAIHKELSCQADQSKGKLYEHQQLRTGNINIHFHHLDL
jgi:hypothetical protein